MFEEEGEDIEDEDDDSEEKTENGFDDMNTYEVHESGEITMGNSSATSSYEDLSYRNSELSSDGLRRRKSSL